MSPQSPFRDGPFRYADAVRAGLSPKVRRGPQFRAPFRGVRVPVHLPDTIEVRARAASLVLSGGAAFVEETAAELFRLPAQDDPLHVRVPSGGAVPRMAGIHATAGLDPADVVPVRGLRVHHPGRVFVDLAKRRDLVGVVALGDALLNRGLATQEALAATVQACCGCLAWHSRGRRSRSSNHARSRRWRLGCA